MYSLHSAWTLCSCLCRSARAFKIKLFLNGKVKTRVLVNCGLQFGVGLVVAQLDHVSDFLLHGGATKKNTLRRGCGLRRWVSVKLLPSSSTAARGILFRTRQHAAAENLFFATQMDR